MPFWQLFVLAAVPSLAAVATAYLGLRDLGLRRRLETSRQFVQLFASAHGRPVDGRDGAGVGEQVATIHLIADFAAREQGLLNAAVAGLRNLESWGKPAGDPTKIDLSELKGKMPDDHLQALEAAVRQAVDSNSPSGRQWVAGAARAALQRLEPKMKPGDLTDLPRPEATPTD